MNSRHDENVVCLATALTPAQAYIWANTLQEENIRCQVVGDFLEAGLGNIPGMVAELWVVEHDVERAKEVLKQHQDFAEDAGRTVTHTEDEDEDEEEGEKETSIQA